MYAIQIQIIRLENFIWIANKTKKRVKWNATMKFQILVNLVYLQNAVRPENDVSFGIRNALKFVGMNGMCWFDIW